MALVKDVLSFLVRASALLAGLGVAAPATGAPVATATARAEVLQPLTLSNSQALSFGSFSVGNAPGTVIIDADSGARSVTGSVVAMGGDVSAARFSGFSSGNRQVEVTTPTASVTLTRAGGGETMTITAFTIEGGDAVITPADNRFTFQVGGTLAVAPGQAEGVYEGSFEVRADYQ